MKTRILPGMAGLLCLGLAANGLAQDARDAPLTLDPVRTVLVRADPPVLPPTPDGKARTATDFAGQSAALLQKYLRKACGVTIGFDIVKEAAVGRDNIVIGLGQTRWQDTAAVKDLWVDGYAIRRSGNIITICGGTRGPTGVAQRGTFNGAAAFLDRFAGVRFYMPGDLWTSLPPDKRVQVPAHVDVRTEPFAKGISMTGLNDGDWLARNAAMTRTGVAGTHQHNVYNAFPPDRFAEKWPDIYPLIGGQRHVPQDAKDQQWNPCFTSPHTIEAAAAMALEFFQNNPDLLWFSLGLQDSNAHCECDGCKAAFAKLEQEFDDIIQNGNKAGIVSTYTAFATMPPPSEMAKSKRAYALSQLQWRLLNEVGKSIRDKAPGKYVEALAYGTTCFAPTFKLEPNVILYSQIHISDDVRGMMKARPDGSLPLDKFLDAPGPYGNHDWYEGDMYLMPRIYSGYYAKFLRHLKAKGKTLVFVHAETYPNWGMDGPKYWVLARQAWDPDADAPTLWKTFAADMFGPAGDEMAQYLSSLERWHNEQSVEKGPKWKLGAYNAIFQRPPEAFKFMKEARAHLDAGARLLQTQEQKDRWDLFSKTFKVTEYLAALGSGEAGPGVAAEAKQYFKDKIAPDPMTLYEKIRKDPAAFGKIVDGVAPKGAPSK